MIKPTHKPHKTIKSWTHNPQLMDTQPANPSNHGHTTSKSTKSWTHDLQIHRVMDKQPTKNTKSWDTDTPTPPPNTQKHQIAVAPRHTCIARSTLARCPAMGSRSRRTDSVRIGVPRRVRSNVAFSANQRASPATESKKQKQKRVIRVAR